MTVRACALSHLRTARGSSIPREGEVEEFVGDDKDKDNDEEREVMLL